jgi:hypothetical protein
MNLLSKLAGVAAVALMAGCTHMAAADAPPAPAAPAAAAPAVAPAPPAAPAPVAAPVAAPAPKPNYVAIPMSIEVNKSAKDVWAKVGGWCDISNWITPTGGVPCVVTSGAGEVGSVRLIAGRVTEVMTAKSEFGYGYTQPNVEGKWYNLYHGFMEVRPVTATTSKIYYTLVQDHADKADQAAIDKDVARLKGQFEGALANMKKLAEK